MTHGMDQSSTKRILFNLATLLSAVFLLTHDEPLWAGEVQQQRVPVAPNPKVTPGDLCTDENPDFDKRDYAERIPRCKRHTTVQLKLYIASQYGNIPREEWKNYEFDHLIPLCVGGSNSALNIWPQPKSQALEKDRLEDSTCQGLQRGKITQQQALDRLSQWFESISHRRDQEQHDKTDLGNDTIQGPREFFN